MMLAPSCMFSLVSKVLFVLLYVFVVDTFVLHLSRTRVSVGINSDASDTW
jgi:hypothetical protein